MLGSVIEISCAFKNLEETLRGILHFPFHLASTGRKQLRLLKWQQLLRSSCSDSFRRSLDTDQVRHCSEAKSSNASNATHCTHATSSLAASLHQCQAHKAEALAHRTSFSLKSSRCCQTAEGSDSIRLTTETVLGEVKTGFIHWFPKL